MFFEEGFLEMVDLWVADLAEHFKKTVVYPLVFFVLIFFVFFLAACGNVRLDVLGQRVVSCSRSDVLVVNNINDTVLRELTISNGRFYLDDRGDGVLTAPEIYTGETLAGEIGYFGRGGYEQIELSAKVFRVSDGSYLGLARRSFSAGDYYYGDVGNEQEIWIVDTFNPVRHLQEVPAETHHGQ